MAVVSSCREMLGSVPQRAQPLPGVICVTGDGRLDGRRKAGMTSSPHGSYGWGDTHATMASTIGGKAARWSESPKLVPVQIGGCNSPP